MANNLKMIKAKMSAAIAKQKVGTPMQQTGVVSPAIDAGSASVNTEIFTYFTAAGEQRVAYSAESWVKLTLELETAGPVAFGTRLQILPVLSGKGALLPVGRSVELFLSKGNRLVLAADALNRVKVIVEPLPWLQAISMQVGSVVGSLASLASAFMNRG